MQRERSFAAFCVRQFRKNARAGRLFAFIERPAKKQADIHSVRGASLFVFVQVSQSMRELVVCLRPSYGPQ